MCVVQTLVERKEKQKVIVRDLKDRIILCVLKQTFMRSSFDEILEIVLFSLIFKLLLRCNLNAADCMCIYVYVCMYVRIFWIQSSYQRHTFRCFLPVCHGFSWSCCSVAKSCPTLCTPMVSWGQLTSQQSVWGFLPMYSCFLSLFLAVFGVLNVHVL